MTFISTKPTTLKYLSDGAIVPSHNGKPITLLNLSMQNSGLPLNPDNLNVQSGFYESYDAPRLLAFLAGYKLTRDPGEKFEDSNVGVGLLGFALAQRAHMSYEELLRQRIFKPLHMDSSTISLSPVQKQHLALGSKNVVLNWDKSAVAGKGGMHSNADDMLKLLAVNMGLVNTPLKAAVERMRSIAPRGHRSTARRHFHGLVRLVRISAGHLHARWRNSRVSLVCRHGYCKKEGRRLFSALVISGFRMSSAGTC